MWEEDEDYLVAESIDLEREKAREMYRATLGDVNLSPRWARILDEVQFVDVVEAIHGPAPSDGMISCPFHGRDATPSFKLYKGSNSAYCFGCPEGQKYYDAVRFTAAKFGYTPLQAIHWLEKRYDLPPLEAEAEELEEGDTVIVNLNFSHLAEPFIRRAGEHFLSTLDPDLAREYIAMYFEAVPGRNANLDSEEELLKTVPLARVLGWKALEQLKKQRLR